MRGRRDTHATAIADEAGRLSRGGLAPLHTVSHVWPSMARRHALTSHADKADVYREVVKKRRWSAEQGHGRVRRGFHLQAVSPCHFL